MHPVSRSALLDLLFPRHCVCCRAVGDELCAACAAELPAAPDLGAPPGMDACWSLLEHRDAGRQVVLGLKYDRHLDAVGLWGRAMAQLVDRPVGVVTWAPTSAGRRRQRGFDQAAVLARAVARPLGVPCVDLLERTTDAGQAGRARVERLHGAEFVAREVGRRAGGIHPGPVLVVDDVRTTGATLSAAADALVAAGLGPILGLTLSVRP
jgi:predicted amidophosphoribosyltransferase